MIIENQIKYDSQATFVPNWGSVSPTHSDLLARFSGRIEQKKAFDVFKFFTE